MKTNLVILAAGNSTRFKTNKLLHFIHNKTIIEYVFDACSHTSFDQIIVVTQYDNIKKLALQYGYKVVINNDTKLGLSHSIKLGTKVSEHCDQIMFLVADQPYIQSQTIQKIVQKGDGRHIICASVNGVIKNPMLFPKAYFFDLCNLKNDDGGKKVARKWMKEVIKIEVDTHELKDIDTRQDL